MLEYLDALDRDRARLANAVRKYANGLKIVPPRAKSPYEHLSPEFMRIHEAGIIGALASALDCLAGVIIGVAALPTKILKADFKRAPGFTHEFVLLT